MSWFRELLKKLLEKWFGKLVKAEYTFEKFAGDWLAINRADVKGDGAVHFGDDGFLMLNLEEAQEWATYRILATIKTVMHSPDQNYHSWGIGVLVEDQERQCLPRYPWIRALDFFMCEVWWNRLVIRGPSKGTADHNYHVANPEVEFGATRIVGNEATFDVEVDVERDRIRFFVKMVGSDTWRKVSIDRPRKPKSGSIAIHSNNMNVRVLKLEVTSD